MGKPFGSVLELKQTAAPTPTPASPPTGSVLLYFKPDGLLYKKDAAGVETVVGATATAPAATVQTNAPASPAVGSFWYDTDEPNVNAIPIGTFTTKGDLLTATAASTVARLGVGANGTILTADSTQAGGVAWGTSVGVAGTVTAQQGLYDGTNRVYSDSNPPETIQQTIFGAGSTVATLAGQAQQFTTDGRSLTMRTSDNTFTRVGFTPVRAATTANITLSGSQIIDGITVVAGDRVLVKDQTTPAQNGVYDVSASTWTRTAGMDTAAGITAQNVIPVQSGSLNGGQLWTTSLRSTDTINTTAMPWVQVGAGNLTSRLTAAVSSSSATVASTGLSVNVLAGQAYNFRSRGHYRSAGTTTGLVLAMGGTCTVTAIRHSATIWGSATSASTPFMTNLTTLTGQAVRAVTFAAATDYLWEIEGLVRVNTAGTFRVDYGISGTAAAVTIQPECFLSLSAVA